MIGFNGVFMVIDLLKLKRTGKSSVDFAFNYEVEDNLTDLPNAKIDDVKVIGTLTITDDKTCYVDAEVSYVLTGDCTRCTRPARTEIVTKLEEEFSCLETEGYSYINDKVDLTKAVKDSIVLSQPDKLLCKEDCKGVCFNCGKNLNDGDCGCQNL